MKILFITAFPPNRKTAGQNYSRQLLNDLSISHSIDLVYWEYPGHKLDISDNINVLKCFTPSRHQFIHLFHNYEFPLFTNRYNKNISKYLNSISDKYDLIYFDFSQVFKYAAEIKHHRKIGMSHDVIAQKFSRDNRFRHLLHWIKFSEKNCIDGLTEIYTFSKKDSNFIESYYNRKSYPVAFYIEPEILNFDFTSIHEICDYYVMYGAWNRKENQESIDWILSYRWSKMPYIKIIGGGMPTNYKEIISKYPNIEYCGFIENPYPIIASSKGLLAPLFHGAGVKVKVIESLALGTPIIGNDITFEGIDNIPFRSTGALININSNELNNTVEGLNTITSFEKNSIRRQFLSIYISTKFIDLLEEFKNK